MELIRINDRKLKIMLTATDMLHFEMNADRLGEDSEQMRRSFRLLMREVRRKIAFDLDDRRVSVQYFPSREGGCEMFVSSLPQNEDKKRSLAAVPAAPLPVKPQKAQSFRRESAYRMKEIGDLLRACERLRASRFCGESRAYRDRRGGYFLLVGFVSASPVRFPEEISFLSEYGELCNLTQIRIYIREHASLISERAVEELASLA